MVLSVQICDKVMLYYLFGDLLGCDVASCYASLSSFVATAADQLQNGMFSNVDLPAFCSYVFKL